MLRQSRSFFECAIGSAHGLRLTESDTRCEVSFDPANVRKVFTELIVAPVYIILKGGISCRQSSINIQFSSAPMVNTDDSIVILDE